MVANTTQHLRVGNRLGCGPDVHGARLSVLDDNLTSAEQQLSVGAECTEIGSPCATPATLWAEVCLDSGDAAIGKVFGHLSA